MKHQVNKLEGALLDGAVAKAERIVPETDWIDVTTQEDYARGERRSVRGLTRYPAFSSDWSLGGPIVERERMTLLPGPPPATYWRASIAGEDAEGNGPTPLIAAMRAFVASKLGEEVELP